MDAQTGSEATTTAAAAAVGILPCSVVNAHRGRVAKMFNSKLQVAVIKAVFIT